MFNFLVNQLEKVALKSFAYRFSVWNTWCWAQSFYNTELSD